MPSNMTFKTNLIPNTDLDFGLGSSDKRWKINGSDDPVLTDENVAQNNSIEAKDFRVLLSGSNNDTDATEGTNKSTNLRFNPSTKVFSVGGDISATGDLTITGNANLNNETYAESITAGSLLVNGAANFVNIPTAPTPAATSNDTSIATTAFVMNAFTANDAMVFKGVINANSGLPADHKQGWTYRIGTAGTYANKVCEVGDIIICVTDGTAANNDHWAVIQNNIDGAVYKGTNAFTDAHIIVADSTAGKVKDSGKTITATAPSSSAADTTIPTSKAVWSAISGASGYGKTGTVTSVQVQASSPLQSSTNTAQTATLNTTISFVNQNANTVLAGPSSGSATAPTFRSLVAADIPKVNNATTADKLSNTAKVGDTNKPVYFTASGVPSAISYTIDKSVPSDAVFTDTHVTAVGNHYAPTADSNAALSVDASSTTAATWGSTSLVTGVNIQRDAKGHVTGVTVDSIKMPANPNTNTDTLVKQTAKTDNVEYKILTTVSASPTSGNAAEAAYGTDFTINPSLKTITAPNFKVTNNATITYNTTTGCLEIIV